MKQDIDTRWADKLWSELRDGLLDVQNTIIAIIRSRAWEPLGYANFSEAWTDKMTGVSIATEIRAHVVYQMFEEGATPERVSETVKGVGPKVAKQLKEQKLSGVPASHATTVVREHERKKPEQHWVTCGPYGEEYLEWKRLARREHTTVKAIAMRAIGAAFKELAE